VFFSVGTLISIDLVKPDNHSYGADLRILCAYGVANLIGLFFDFWTKLYFELVASGYKLFLTVL
jgi:hypothetical protein